MNNNDSDNVVQSDYEYSKGVYLDLIERGQEALQQMMDVADESQHPRAYEVLANLIKTISDTNDKVMDLNKKVKDINKKDTKDPAQIESGKTTNNVFIGSTTDLQRMLQDASKEKIVDITPEDK